MAWQPVSPINVQSPLPITPKKRPRVFMWSFLAIQALFMLWIIVGIHSNATNQGTETTSQAIQFCSNGWQDLYNSYAACVQSYGGTLNAASDTGTAIGAGIIIFIWVATDVILGIGRLIVLAARRR
jgi:hypothetical protein